MHLHASIVAYTAQHNEVARWSFQAGWPVSLVQYSTNGTMEEKLTLTCEKMIRGTLTVTNRAPWAILPDPMEIAITSSVTFTVNAFDPDSDPVTLINLYAPPGALFTNNTFTWTASAGDIGTTNTIAFKLDDQQNKGNSVVTNATTIIVASDYDHDSLRDDWEVSHFAGLQASPIDDPDGDRMNNLQEYITRTDPTNQTSVFQVGRINETVTNILIPITGQPGVQYTIEFNDQNLADTNAWQSFANPQHGIWTCTNEAPVTHTFIDDQSGATTQTPPADHRYYRVKAASSALLTP